MPEKAGQICRLINPSEDENLDDVYIVAEDPASFDATDNIYVVNLKELQRNIQNPANSQRIPIEKQELKVIADNLEAYIQGWN